MKNQITKNLGTKMLGLVLMLMFSLTSFAQIGGPGPGGPNQGNGHHHGNPFHHPCDAHFKSKRDSIPNGIRFENNHSGTGAATYAWDFGDGSTGTGEDPSHTYAAQGMYYVCLTVTDTVNGGCSNTWCDSVRVFTPPPHCNAHFKHHLDTIANGIRFRAKGNSPGATYAWDFGDGSTGTGPNPNHAYASAGTYWVCLYVSNTNAGGSCADTTCDSVRVFTPPPHCHAEVDARRDTTVNGVNFSSGHNSYGATYAWDFGDGSTSADPNPNHVYATAGTYWVCLTVSNTNAGGTCTDTDCDSVNTNHLHGGPGHHHRLGSDVENSSEVSVVVYPNPIVETATIHIENTSGNVIFRVYQINGQLSMEKVLGNGDFTISKENLSVGMYFYSVEDGNNTVARGKFRVN